MMYRLSLKTGLHIEDFDNQKNKCGDNRQALFSYQIDNGWCLFVFIDEMCVQNI